MSRAFVYRNSPAPNATVRTQNSFVSGEHVNTVPSLKTKLPSPAIRDPDGTTIVSFAGKIQPVVFVSDRFPVAFLEMDWQSVSQVALEGKGTGSACQDDASSRWPSSKEKPNAS